MRSFIILDQIIVVSPSGAAHDDPHRAPTKVSETSWAPEMNHWCLVTSSRWRWLGHVAGLTSNIDSRSLVFAGQTHWSLWSFPSNGWSNCFPCLENGSLASPLRVDQTLWLVQRVWRLLMCSVINRGSLHEVAVLTSVHPLLLCCLPPTLFSVFVMPVVPHYNCCSLERKKNTVLAWF